MSLFQSKKKTKDKPEGLTTFLQYGTRFIGDVTSTGPMRIDADFHGNIDCTERVIIGHTAFIKGTIHAAEVEIYGVHEGDMHAGTIHLKTGCRVLGDISCENLLSEQGASFNGNCKTSESKKVIDKQQTGGIENLPLVCATDIPA